MTAVLDKPATRLTPPPRARMSAKVVGAVVVFAALVAYTWDKTGIDPGELVHGWNGITDFVSRAMPPDLRWHETVEPGLQALLLTFSMGFLGTVFALPTSLVLAVLGSRTLGVNRVAYQLARLSMGSLRAVPTVVFGLVFLTAVGLGPFCGVLAIFVHSTGVCAKTWSEAMDEVDQGPIEALRTTGASRLQVLQHALLPTVAPTLAGLTLYRLDVNVRESLVLGLIGCGGIGFQIDAAESYFRFDTMVTLIGMVLVLVVAMDLLSSSVRKKLAA